MVGMCFDIDNAEVSDSMIVERSPLLGLSAASEICGVEDCGVPKENRARRDQLPG